MDYIIRPVIENDAEGLWQLRFMPGVFEDTLGIPSAHLSTAKERLRTLSNDTHQFVAVGEKDGKEIILGTAALDVNSSSRLRHSASIGIAIHADYQNIGIGSALMETLLDIADNWLMLVRVELSVFENNARAIHLYEKFGFVKEGFKRYASIRAGRYENEYLMARICPNIKLDD